MDMHARLAALGLRLPEASAPVANYVPYVRSGGLVFVSGQISKVGDDVVRGRLGEDRLPVLRRRAGGYVRHAQGRLGVDQIEDPVAPA